MTRMLTLLLISAMLVPTASAYAIQRIDHVEATPIDAPDLTQATNPVPENNPLPEEGTNPPDAVECPPADPNTLDNIVCAGYAPVEPIVASVMGAVVTIGGEAHAAALAAGAVGVNLANLGISTGNGVKDEAVAGANAIQAIVVGLANTAIDEANAAAAEGAQTADDSYVLVRGFVVQVETAADGQCRANLGNARCDPIPWIVPPAHILA